MLSGSPFFAIFLVNITKVLRAFHLNLNAMAFNSTVRKSSFGATVSTGTSPGTRPLKAFASGRKRKDDPPSQPNEMPAQFFKTNIFCTMNALYSLLSNTLPTQKTMLIGLVISGLFTASNLDAQVVEPVSSSSSQEETVIKSLQNEAQNPIIPGSSRSTIGPKTACSMPAAATAISRGNQRSRAA